MFFSRKKIYRVSIEGDDWVTPEETLLDSSSDHSDLEMPIGNGAFRMTTAIIGLFALVIVGVIFNMTVLRHDFFSALAIKNKTVNFSVAPPRGLVLDRNGKALVSNLPSFDLLVVTRELLKGPDRADELAKVADLIGQPPEDLTGVIQQGSQSASTFFAAQDLTKDQVLKLSYLAPKGFYIITSSKRSYVNGPQFSTVIGYVGKVNRDDLNNDSYYLPSDIIGRLGIEGSYESMLRGTHGKIVFTKKDQESTSQDPVIGNSVVLNIDFDLQKKLYSTLFGILQEAKLSSAAAVIQNPQNGQVLAMVSFPGYDNNLFNDQVTSSEYKQLFESKLKPLFNRVISGLYNPGSTIKPFIGMAGLQEHVITPEFAIKDCINLTVPNPQNPEQPYIFKNWRVDLGLFNLRRAIANSCNVFFFTVGGGFGSVIGLGAEKIAHFLITAFANKVLGIDLPGEVAGFVPTPDWKQATRHEPWYQGDTYNISIGQGDLLVSPLWLNAYVSAVANGGTLWKPMVAQKVIDPDKKTLIEYGPEALGQLPFDSSVIQEVHNDMRETVLTGTARVLQDLPVTSGAKTGTAEVIKGHQINSLFTAFAPLDKPEISITVLVEGSPSNEGYAIRTANEVLKWYFSPK